MAWQRWLAGCRVDWSRVDGGIVINIEMFMEVGRLVVYRLTEIHIHIFFLFLLEL